MKHYHNLQGLKHIYQQKHVIAEAYDGTNVPLKNTGQLQKHKQQQLQEHGQQRFYSMATIRIDEISVIDQCIELRHDRPLLADTKHYKALAKTMVLCSNQFCRMCSTF